MVNDSEGIRKLIRRIIIIAIIIILGFTIKGKIIGAIDDVKSKFGTPVFDDGHFAVNNKTVEEQSDAAMQSEIEEKRIIYVISERSVNIREDAGVDYKRIIIANRGAEFVGTGHEKEASNGRLWYEIYINDEKTEVGWVSSKVVKQKE